MSNKKGPGTVWAVHCIDTEGPLEESLDATFERINGKFGTSFEPSREILIRLQNKEMPLDGREAAVAAFIAPNRLAYLSTWAEIEEMISRVTAPAFRKRNHDSMGGPYTFSWFVIDVVGYANNPRRKAFGYHAVWDQYQRMLRDTGDLDSFGWHFHTVPVGGNALEYNTCWTNNDHHEQVLARRIIQRRAFPTHFRAGGVIERNDLSWWLEQFIPFDYSSAANLRQSGNPGALWDWRHAPARWRPYHPDWYDYRRSGAMRRSIFRCLEIIGYEYVLTEQDVREAFEAAANGEDVVLAYSSHDRRSLEPDVALAVTLLRQVSGDYSNVPWRFANAVDAARRVSGCPSVTAPRFSAQWKDGVLWIESDQGLFGPAPFLAVEEEGEVFFRDNPTVEGERCWAYVPPRPRRTRRLGIAGSNPAGCSSVLVVDM